MGKIRKSGLGGEDTASRISTAFKMNTAVDERDDSPEMR